MLSISYSFLVVRTDRLGRALSPAASDHERTRNLETEEHETNLDQPDRKPPKQSAKLNDPTARERMEHDLTHCSCRAWCEICVGARSPDQELKLIEGNPSDRVLLHIRNRSAWRAPAKSCDHGRDGVCEQILLEVDGKAQGSWRRVCGSGDAELQRHTWHGQGRADVWPGTVDDGNCAWSRADAKQQFWQRAQHHEDRRAVLAEVSERTGQCKGNLEHREHSWWNKTEIDVGADHGLMGWITRHCCSALSRFQVKGARRTANTNTRGKEHDMLQVQFREVCSFQRHDADDAKVELRWTNGVFAGQGENPKISCCRPRQEHWSGEFPRDCLGKNLTPFLAARVESSYRYVLVMLRQRGDHQESTSNNTFLKHTAQLLVA